MSQAFFHLVTCCAVVALLACPTGCNAPPADIPPATRTPAATTPTRTAHPATAAIDRFDSRRSNAEDSAARLHLYRQRWSAVQRAVAHHGTTHDNAFYGSRSYWHTRSTRGLGWAIDQAGDLNQPAFVDGPGNVRVLGDVNADLEVRGNAVVHILGDLNAPLELKGVGELIIAGRITDNATIICDGQLALFVGGDSAGVLGATSRATIIIDGDARGIIQCGAPATDLTVTGDLSAQLAAPPEKNAVLTLRVEGFTPASTMLNLQDAGFTRINATLGKSNTPPGVYPSAPDATLPVVRWVVLEQAQR